MSQITGGIPFVVDGPIPAPPPHGLLKTAEVITVGDPHWQNGIQLWGYPPDLPSIWDGCSDPGTYTKATGESAPLPEFAAYTVLLAITCSTVGIDWNDLEAWKARAVRSFEAVESYALENEIASGAQFPLQPYFGDTNATILNSGSVTAGSSALALMEDAIGGTGKQGMIHATPGTVSRWSKEFLVYEKNGNLDLGTVNGTPVVSGGGYLGVTPDGEAAASDGEAWAFATGPLKIIRGEVFVLPETPKEALDRTTNVATFRAERNYVVSWDTALQAAVLVDWSA